MRVNDSLRALGRQVVRLAVPHGLLAVVIWPGRRARTRLLALAGLVAVWVAVYRRYRDDGRRQTLHEFELLRSANLDAFSRHYNEQVPTITEEFELWGAFHQHRHEMRYALVADAVRAHLPTGGAVLDIGCGSALVAERLQDLSVTYVGLDFPAHQISFAQGSFSGRETSLRTAWARGDGERLPFADGSFDVVVMTEVIEHLLHPENAVWEVSRVLRRGGTYVMTTNNASEVPLRTPVSHLFAWVEKALGAKRPDLISLRPWVWPQPVHESLLPPGSPPVYLPHTHHIYAQTRDLFASAGLSTFEWSTFEFPPPQAALTTRLDGWGEAGRRTADILETGARRTPLLNRMGCHLFMLARRVGEPIAADPPAGIWPGPLSGAAPEGVSSRKPDELVSAD
jgi:ubiquinone/menaquinone biosynthesis C-methylase UbiE